MDVSVIIPTHRRGEKLAACLRSLSRQSIDRFEVLVGLDGPDLEAAAQAMAAWQGPGERLRIVECPREGYNAVRNRLLVQARGRVMLSLNDDVVADRYLVETHAEEHARQERRGKPAVIVGRSPWRRPADETLFDVMVQRTSLIFFYDQMDTAEGLADPDRDWGFRHCWGLNFSALRESVNAVGGFTAVPLAYGYDDIELAWRLKLADNTAVLYRPSAAVEHDHRYTPAEVLQREERLGSAAWHFAAIRPAFCRELFGRDIRAQAELDYSREFLAREAPAAARLAEDFCELGRTPAAATDSESLIRTIARQQHFLRRWHWRKGMLAAADAAKLRISA